MYVSSLNILNRAYYSELDKLGKEHNAIVDTLHNGSILKLKHKFRLNEFT